MIWTPTPPEVAGPYLLLGCPPGKYLNENGAADLFNEPGSIQTITKDRASLFVHLRATIGTPYLFADREAWWQAGGPRPGQEEKPAPLGSAEMQARIDYLEHGAKAVSNHLDVVASAARKLAGRESL